MKTIKRVTCTKPVSKSGNGLAVAVTGAVKELGIGSGEFVRVSFENNLSKITADKKVMVKGTSFMLSVTKELKALGYEHGDVVRVTLEKIN